MNTIKEEQFLLNDKKLLSRENKENKKQTEMNKDSEFFQNQANN